MELKIEHLSKQFKDKNNLRRADIMKKESNSGVV